MKKAASTLVWDLFIRTFHWALVAAFLISFATEDEAFGLHIAAGYAVLGLVIARMIWGMVGSTHARFSDFVRPPSEVWQYLKKTVFHRAPRYLGHNPAGGFMVLVLMLMLLACGITGVWLLEGKAGESIVDLHELLANATLGLILLHVAGMLFSSWSHKENLVWAMINGRKPLRETDQTSALSAGVKAGRNEKPRTVLVLGAVAGLFITAILMAPLLPATDTDEVRKYLDSGDIVPFEQIVSSVREQFSGRILESELERKDDRLIYEIEILDAEGKLQELKYDAQTGVLLKQEYED